MSRTGYYPGKKDAQDTSPNGQREAPVPTPILLAGVIRAELPVLPGEDADALHQRLNIWIIETDARSDLEKYLVEAAVHASWKLDRGLRAEAAALTKRVLAVSEQADDAEID